jgi:hypothetical protein
MMVLLMLIYLGVSFNPKTYFYKPKIGEAVFTFSNNSKFSDRMYVGPIITTSVTGYDPYHMSALAGLSLGSEAPCID